MTIKAKNEFESKKELTEHIQKVVDGEILINIGRPDAEHLNDQDVINTFVWMISELSKSVGITTTIKDYGAKEEDFEMLADKAMNDPCKPGNPREVSKEEFIELYRKAM